MTPQGRVDRSRSNSLAQTPDVKPALASSSALPPPLDLALDLVTEANGSAEKALKQVFHGGGGMIKTKNAAQAIRGMDDSLSLGFEEDLDVELGDGDMGGDARQSSSSLNPPPVARRSESADLFKRCTTPLEDLIQEKPAPPRLGVNFDEDEDEDDEDGSEIDIDEMSRPSESVPDYGFNEDDSMKGSPLKDRRDYNSNEPGVIRERNSSVNSVLGLMPATFTSLFRPSGSPTNDCDEGGNSNDRGRSSSYDIWVDDQGGPKVSDKSPSMPMSSSRENRGYSGASDIPSLVGSTSLDGGGTFGSSSSQEDTFSNSSSIEEEDGSSSPTQVNCLMLGNRLRVDSLDSGLSLEKYINCLEIEDLGPRAQASIGDEFYNWSTERIEGEVVSPSSSGPFVLPLLTNTSFWLDRVLPHLSNNRPHEWQNVGLAKTLHNLFAIYFSSLDIVRITLPCASPPDVFNSSLLSIESTLALSALGVTRVLFISWSQMPGLSVQTLSFNPDDVGIQNCSVMIGDGCDDGCSAGATLVACDSGEVGSLRAILLHSVNRLLLDQKDCVSCMLKSRPNGRFANPFILPGVSGNSELELGAMSDLGLSSPRSAKSKHKRVLSTNALDRSATGLDDGDAFEEDDDNADNEDNDCNDIITELSSSSSCSSSDNLEAGGVSPTQANNDVNDKHDNIFLVHQVSRSFNESPKRGSLTQDFGIKALDSPKRSKIEHGGKERRDSIESLELDGHPEEEEEEEEEDKDPLENSMDSAGRSSPVPLLTPPRNPNEGMESSDDEDAEDEDRNSCEWPSNLTVDQAVVNAMEMKAGDFQVTEQRISSFDGRDLKICNTNKLSYGGSDVDEDEGLEPANSNQTTGLTPMFRGMAQNNNMFATSGGRGVGKLEDFLL